MLAHLGGYVPHLEAMWAHLGAMLAHLGGMLAHLGGYVGRSWGYVGPSWGLWVPMLTYLEPHVRCLCKNMLNVTGPKNTVNYRGFCRHAHPTGGRRQGPNYVGPSWGLCWPILRAMWAQLGSWGYVSPSWGLCWPILRLCWPILRPMGAHVDLSWATCAMFVQKHAECHRAKKHCKLQGFLSTRAPYRRSAAGAQLCWPILGPMLAYLAGNVGSAWGYVGLSWRLCGPILRPLSADLEAYVGPCWPVWSQKIRKMGTAKKHCKTQDILRVGGLSWSYVGLSWGYVGPSWGYVGPSWGYVGPSWGYVGPSWGLCWPILRPLLAQVDPS